MTKSELFKRLVEIGKEIAKEENLPLKEINRNAGGGKFGFCTNDGIIHLTIKHYALQEVMIEENARTLAHELAHLIHFHHEPSFWSKCARLCGLVEKKLGHRVRSENAMLRGYSNVQPIQNSSN